ncbi:MAG: hypothetical protein C5B56_06425 [Proteobacteria bacterium]|nr:MAG: hypothetical protein C5B56_06425 [Pseudomonadota bacterium]
MRFYSLVVLFGFLVVDAPIWCAPTSALGYCESVCQGEAIRATWPVMVVCGHELFYGRKR